MISWSISWSFALLRNCTPNIIDHLVYSDTIDSVKVQEATVIQRWLIIRQIAEFYHNVLANSLGAMFTLGLLIFGTYHVNVLAGHSLIAILLFWVLLLRLLSPKALRTAKNYALMEETVGRNVRSTISLRDMLMPKFVFEKYIKKIAPNVSTYSKTITLQGFYGSLLYGLLTGSHWLHCYKIITILTSANHTIGIATAATLFLFTSKITSPLSRLLV